MFGSRSGFWCPICVKNLYSQPQTPSDWVFRHFLLSCFAIGTYFCIKEENIDGSYHINGLSKQRFLQEAQTKPVICFGAGELMKIVDKNTIQPNHLTVKYIIANKCKEQGRTYLGYNVYAPEKLLEEPDGSFVLLITTYSAYEVNEQLEAMGIKVAYPAASFCRGLFRRGVCNDPAQSPLLCKILIFMAYKKT